MFKLTPRSETLHPAQQIAILMFSGFYFIRWFTEPMSPSDWLVQIGAYCAFLVAYFIGFNIRALTLTCALFLVALSFLIAPYNYGANSFAIFACSFFAYFQPPKRAVMLIAFTLAVVLMTTLIYELHLLYYFGITTMMIFGLGFSGIIDRQRMAHQRREHHSQNEIQRLAKEAERERIGQDLHDVIGHSLTSIHLKAQLATKRLTQGQLEEARDQCEAIANLASHALKEIRETLAGIQRQGLREELCAQQQGLADLGIEFNFSLPEEMLIPTVESDLMLISRELITNTLKHAQATQIQLTLSFIQDTLTIHYYDNGQGMSCTTESAFGNGLQGIRRRVQVRQGTVGLRNNNGLNVDITLPQLAPDRP